MTLQDGPDEYVLSFADSTKCSRCNDGGLYVWYLPNSQAKVYMVACESCGSVFYYGNSATKAKNILNEHKTGDSLADKQQLSPKEAYEMNKTRSSCVVCGNPTIPKELFASVVQYCPCVEKL